MKKINLMPNTKLNQKIEKSIAEENKKQKEKTNPKTPEEIETEKEIENLSPEDRGKIGWGLSTIGFKVEKAKNDLFAGAFNKALNKIDKKGTTGRFFTEMQKGFERDAKVAFKKAEDTTSGKEKHRLSNASLLFGNLVRYGRMVTDLTGASLASPLRYVMMGGMATARMAEAGKEARLKNEEVIEKTRIQDVERAEEEAWKIYEKAQQKEQQGNVSAEALKNAYLMEMPKDLQERLKIPDVANSFIQKILKTDIEGGLALLEIKITKIQGDGGLTHEQKEAAIEKLLIKEKKNLEDCDRIITQYGTVDGLAMAGRYAQTAGKTIVAVVTVETLALSVDKMFESVSHLLTSHNIHPIDGAGKFVKGILHREKTIEKPEAPTPVPKPALDQGPTSPAPADPEPEASAAPETPKPTTEFTNEGIKFENGKGGIQGILDLKKQIAEQYHGDYSKAPKSVQDLMSSDHNAVEEAKKFGFYKPNGEESALIREGSTLKFDDKGNLIFHDAATGKDVERYGGKMFDSDGSAKVSTESGNEVFESKEDSKIHLGDDLHTKIKVPELKLESDVHPYEPAPKSVTPEELTKTIHDQLTPKEPAGTIHTGTSQETGMKRNTGGDTLTGNSADTGRMASTGGGVLYSGGGNGYPLDKLQGFSDHAKPILALNPEFLENPYNLSEEKLMQAYGARQNDVDYLSKLEPSTWSWNNFSSTLKMNASEVLKYEKQPSTDPATNHLSSYLNILKNHAGLKPKGFIGIGEESTEHFIARCLQALAAGKGKDGITLEIFEANLRK
ncbi:MAG: hypothetical protein WC671_01265 [Candidatus Paceibacterota bacterium]|jgi:hypothetical protein